MKKQFDCPYIFDEKCGHNENCIGCCHDPLQREMTYDQFRDIHYHWNCDDCRFCNPKADLEGVESPCKRLDHKHFSFAKGIFASYDCGQRNSYICADFEPKEWKLWLYRHWQPQFIDELRKEIPKNKTVGICIDHDWSVRYSVNEREFFDNNFLDSNGNLKWIRKGYYKRSKKSPIGYVYCYEYPNGEIIYGANSYKEYEAQNN